MDKDEEMMMRLTSGCAGLLLLLPSVRAQQCLTGGSVTVTVGGTEGPVVTTLDMEAGASALYACSLVNAQWGGSVTVSCAEDGSGELSGDATHCLETTTCHSLADTFVTACDTSGEPAGETTCPAGCMEAYNALVADTACVEAWTEPVFSGDTLGPFARILASSFGLDDGTMPWGIQGAWSRLDNNVENIVRWVSLRNRLQSRCLWPDYASECSYRYFMAVEVLSGPGESLGYNCAVKSATCTETATVSVDADAAACAGVTQLDSATACEAVLTADPADDAGATACTYTPLRDTCSAECDEIKAAVLDNCDATDTYTNSAGIVADYDAMVGAMQIQMACAEFTCSLNAIGEAFCGVLESLATLDVSTEDPNSGQMTAMSGFVTLGCNAQLQDAPFFMSLLPDEYLPPRALDCIDQQSASNGNVRVKNVCACTMTEMCPGDGRWAGPDGVVYRDTTTTTCTLVASTDHGYTRGTCTDSDTSDRDYCTYTRGSYCWSTGTADTVAIPDSCTSVAVDGGAETAADTANCYLERTTDFGITPGTCASNNDAAYTCTYVAGTYCSSTGTPDTQVAPDSCKSTTAGGDVTDSDSVNCVLTGSNDFGVTPGSCAAVDSDVATCEYIPGRYRCGSTFQISM